MTFPTSPDTPILDTANRPDEGPPPSASWFTPVGADGLVIDTLQIATDPAAAAGGVGCWAATCGPDCEIYAPLNVLQDDGNDAMLLVRWNGINPGDPGWSCYILVIGRNDGGNDAVGVVSPGGIVIAPAIINLLAGDTFWLRAVGTRISVHQKHAGGNWSEVAFSINSDVTIAGYIGLGTTDKTVRFGYLGGGTISVPVVCPTFAPPAMPSHHRSTGLSITAEDPLLKQTRGWSERLTDQIQSYTHELRAIGGYWQAETAINHNQDAIEDWIQNGLARHITVKDEAGIQIFEGFVNKMTAKLGPLEFVIGPLLDIGNENAYVYSTIDNSTNPPTMGVRAKTAYIADVDSQAAYGIIQKVQSTSGSTAALALQYANTFTVENAWPPTSRQSTLLGGSPGNLQLEILGYWHWLTAYVYNQTAVSGEIGVSTKMIAVLAAQPNANLFSTDYGRITPNAVLVPQYENDDRTAEDIMKGLNAVGSASYERMNCGFYNRRQFVYDVAAQEIRYIQRITSNGAIMDMVGNRIDPWRVVPNGYIYYADFLAGRLPPVTPAQLKRDPRCGFVETVKFTAPYGLDVNGIKVNTLDQMLCRAGLRGQGA